MFSPQCDIDDTMFLELVVRRPYTSVRTMLLSKSLIYNRRFERQVDNSNRNLLHNARVVLVFALIQAYSPA